MRRTSRPLLPAVLAMTLLLTACAGIGPSPSDDGIQHPEGDALVFSMAYQGGFVPPEFIFSAFPSFAMFGDGRVVVAGAQVEIFPGPALPAMNVRKLSEQGIQAVLSAVAASRQFGADAEWRGAQNFVADAPDTVFRLNADGREVTVNIYGLGTFSPNEPPQGIAAAEVAAHQALGQLSERLTVIDSWMPADGWADAAWQPYQPEAMRLLVRNADNDPPDDAGPGQRLEWPIDGDAAAFGDPWRLADGTRCGAVSGTDAEAWYESLAQANQLTRWTSGQHVYQVTPRFLLPDEEATCPDTV